MEVQAECVEPPVAPSCDVQPSGKINKAAFKLFGKRRSGTGMAGFFSFRNKGGANGNANSENGNSVNGNSVNGNSVNGNSATDLIRSKTHDGLTSERGEEPGSQEAGPARSLGKSLSFFSLLRRGSGRANEGGASGAFGRRGRGLKGLFSSFRWRRKDRAIEGEAEEGREEEVKDVTLTLEPQPCLLQEDPGSSEAESSTRGGEETSANITMTPAHCVAMTATPSDSPVASPLRDPALSKAKVVTVSSAMATPTLERCSGLADPPPSSSEPSVDRLCSLLFTDVTSLKSFDSLTGCGDIIADAEEEAGGGGGGSATSSSSSGGGGGGGGRSLVRVSPAKPPLSAPISHPSLPAASVPAPLPSRARVTPPPSQQPSGSGVVAYMGGGEEMASPDGVDDADMQGLWHMLPSTGDNSPALPRTHPGSSHPALPRTHPPHPGSTHPPRSTHNPPKLTSSVAFRSMDRQPTQVRALGLSKIPVVGGGLRAGKPPLPHTHARHPASPNEKEPLSDEGYWDTPNATPMATPDDGGSQRNQRIGLPRDSCSGDHLYDLYNDPEEEPERWEEDGGEQEEEEEEEEDAGDYRLSPPSLTTPPSSSSSSSFRSVKGSTSLPRESKIPLSLKQTTPPHSVSQSALSSVLEVSPPPPKSQAPPPPARTRIPVSKVPVRRSGNKPGNATRGHAHRK